MMIYIVIFQLVLVFKAYKILKFQRKKVWNEDRSNYKLIPIKQCRMFWFLFFVSALLPGLGFLVISTFTIYVLIIECDYIEWPKLPSFITKIYNYLFKELI